MEGVTNTELITGVDTRLNKALSMFSPSLAFSEEVYISGLNYNNLVAKSVYRDDTNSLEVPLKVEQMDSPFGGPGWFKFAVGDEDDEIIIGVEFHADKDEVYSDIGRYTNGDTYNFDKGYSLVFYRKIFDFIQSVVTAYEQSYTHVVTYGAADTMTLAEWLLIFEDTLETAGYSTIDAGRHWKKLYTPE